MLLDFFGTIAGRCETFEGALALGLGAGADLQKPLAIAVIGGLDLSTPVTLLIVPGLDAALRSTRRARQP
jgi:Cu/Ag efflux pump CusA